MRCDRLSIITVGVAFRNVDIVRVLYCGHFCGFYQTEVKEHCNKVDTANAIKPYHGNIR